MKAKYNEFSGDERARGIKITSGGIGKKTDSMKATMNKPITPRFIQKSMSNTNIPPLPFHK